MGRIDISKPTKGAHNANHRDSTNANCAYRNNSNPITPTRVQSDGEKLHRDSWDDRNRRATVAGRVLDMKTAAIERCIRLALRYSHHEPVSTVPFNEARAELAAIENALAEKRYSANDVENAVERVAGVLFQVLELDCEFPIDHQAAAHRMVLDVAAMIEGDTDHTSAPWEELSVFKVAL